MDGRRGLGVGCFQSSPDGSDVQLTWRTTDLYWWGKETSWGRRGPESKGLGSTKQWPTLPSLLRTVPILKPSLMSRETPPPQANWDCWLPYIPQVLSKDKGSQMTISVRGKWICLPNFSLYNPLKPYGLYMKHTMPFHLRSITTNGYPWFHNLHSLCFALWCKAWLLSIKLQAPIWPCGFIPQPCCLRRDMLRDPFFFFFLLPFTKKFPMPED